MAIRRQVSLVLRLIDTFGTRNITNALVVTDRGTVPIDKKNGYYVFMDLHPMETSISINATGYEPVTRTVEPHWRYDQDGRVIIILLKPVAYIGSDFKKAAGVLYDAGGQPMKHQEFIYSLYPPTSVTLLAAGRQGETGLPVSVPRWLILEGQQVVIGRSVYEIVSFDTETGLYTLNRPLNEERAIPMGTALYCVYGSVTDAEGRFEVYRHYIYSSKNGCLWIETPEAPMTKKEFAFGSDVRL